MAQNPARVAVVVEDDPDVRDLLRTLLIRSGFEVVLAADGASGIAAVREHEPVVTTLDVSMPGIDGFAVAREIRAFSDTYVVVISGLSDEIDVVQALEAGADDYLVKPFRPRELRARIESLLRRPRRIRDGRPGGQHGSERTSLRTETPPPVQAAPPPGAASATAGPATGSSAGSTVGVLPGEEPGKEKVAAASGALEHDGLLVHPERRLASVDGRAVDLTRTEFDLLASLMESGGRVRSRADLVLTLRGLHDEPGRVVASADKRAVEVHVSNLRRKLGDSSVHPRWIETVHGVGYRLRTS